MHGCDKPRCLRAQVRLARQDARFSRAVDEKALQPTLAHVEQRPCMVLVVPCQANPRYGHYARAIVPVASRIMCRRCCYRACRNVHVCALHVLLA